MAMPSSVELLGNAAGGFDLPRHQLAHVFQVHMAGHELGKGVGNRNDRLAEVLVAHAGRPPQGARARHVASMGRGLGAIVWHSLFLFADLPALTILYRA
jgi:hypothetical protein